MQLSTLTSLFAAFSVTSAIQINYYSDGGCSDFLTSPPNVPIGGTCYDYSWTGQNSATIANCDKQYDGCWCDFYTQAGCKGAVQATRTGSYGDNNCASNYGHGFLSFRCYVDHGL